MIGDDEAKRCTQCGVTKTGVDFYKNRCALDGRQNICIDCRKEYNQSKIGKSDHYKANAKYDKTDLGKITKTKYSTSDKCAVSKEKYNSSDKSVASNMRLGLRPVKSTEKPIKIKKVMLNRMLSTVTKRMERI